MLQLALPFPTQSNEPAAPTPELRRFLDCLPGHLADRLTAEERAAYAAALTPKRSPHWLDFKASLPLPGSGIYVAVMVGRERRSAARLRQEGQRGLTPNLIVAGVLIATVVAGCFAAIVLIKALKVLADDGGDLWWHAYAGPL